MTPAQIEAIAQADAHLSNAGLPTVASMRQALQLCARALEECAAGLAALDRRCIAAGLKFGAIDAPPDHERGDVGRARSAATLARTLAH